MSEMKAERRAPRYFLLVHPKPSPADSQDTQFLQLEDAIKARKDVLTKSDVVVCVVASRRDCRCLPETESLPQRLCDRIGSYLISLSVARSEAVLISAIGGIELGRWWGNAEIIDYAIEQVHGAA